MEGREVQSEALTSRRPRRRGLLVLSVVTALACGAAVGVLGPQILVGETARKPYLAAGEVAPAARSGAEPLDLDGRLGLAPQEIRVNQRRWEAMSETERLTVVAQYRRLAEMDAAERDQLLQKYEDFRQLSGDRQADLRRRPPGWRRSSSPSARRTRPNWKA